MGPVTVDATSTGKTALRRRLLDARRARRSDRDPETEATALADHASALVQAHTNGRVCRVAAYESLLTEPSTRVLVEQLVAEGYEVIVPITLADRDLDWRMAGSTEPLGRNAIHAAEVIVAPALAVDRDGNRLGRGGGSYDRALARRRPDALVVALLYDDELLEPGAVPTEAHDVAVDVAVTPSRGVVRLGSA
jgi:5-formyltetrahydrofolate cyclo-ligase